MGRDIRRIELDFVNVYLVRTEKGFVLIDTGLPAHWEQLERELSARGCAPGALSLVILTHGDGDHAGNAARLRREYGAKIAMHKGDLAMAQGKEPPKRKVRSISGKLLFFYGRISRKLRESPGRPGPFAPDLLLSDGQSLEEFGFDAKAVHIPGHTPGSIGIVTGEGDLFAGDTLQNAKIPGIALSVEDFRALERSVGTLEKMRLRTVYPGHGRPFTMAALGRAAR